MIKSLIIEDEKPASEHLLKLLNSSGYDIQVIKILGSVNKAVEWFNSNSHPSLVFMDIQLSDGLSFEIFKKTQINCPVIFTTAFEEYAIKAFKVNSIDYLLKPVSSEALSFALEKFSSQQIRNLNFSGNLIPYRIDQVMQLLTKKHKSRYVVNTGVHIRSIDSKNINCFYSLAKTTYLMDNSGQSYDINYTLEQLDELNDPIQFFRINRKYIINRAAIKDIISFSPNKLKIIVEKINDPDTFVSRSRLKNFRNWLEK